MLKLPGKQPVIAEAACTMNKIVIRALLFLRLYLIHHRDDPPVVDADFVDTVFKTVCVVKACRQATLDHEGPEGDAVGVLQAALRAAAAC